MKPDLSNGLYQEFREFLMKSEHFDRFKHVLDVVDSGILYLHSVNKDLDALEFHDVNGMMKDLFPKAVYLMVVNTKFDKLTIHQQNRLFFECALRIPEDHSKLKDYEIKTMYEALDLFIKQGRVIAK